MDDDGASHPEAGVRVRRAEDQPLGLRLGDPAQGDLLTGLPAGVPQLGAGQQPPGSPGGTGGDKTGHECQHRQKGCEKPEAVIQSRPWKLCCLSLISLCRCSFQDRE